MCIGFTDQKEGIQDQLVSAKDEIDRCIAIRSVTSQFLISYLRAYLPTEMLSP
jgi:hypothetical protein